MGIHSEYQLAGALRFLDEKRTGEDLHDGSEGQDEGSSLAYVHPTRMRVVSPHRAGEDVKKPAPQDTQTRSRLIIGQNGPSDSALAATSGWRLLAAQPLTGTLRAALLGACARACVPRRYTPSAVIG